jgi:hypothetical protein
MTFGHSQRTVRITTSPYRRKRRRPPLVGILSSGGSNVAGAACVYRLTRVRRLG